MSDQNRNGCTPHQDPVDGDLDEKEARLQRMFKTKRLSRKALRKACAKELKRSREVE